MPLKELTGQQQRSNWHVLDSKSQCELVLADVHSETFWRKSITTPRPNVALLDTTAENLEHGLFHGPVIDEQTASMYEILRSAGISCLHFGKDGAGSNRRMTA